MKSRGWSCHSCLTKLPKYIQRSCTDTASECSQTALFGRDFLWHCDTLKTLLFRPTEYNIDEYISNKYSSSTLEQLTTQPSRTYWASKRKRRTNNTNSMFEMRIFSLAEIHRNLRPHIHNVLIDFAVYFMGAYVFWEYSHTHYTIGNWAAEMWFSLHFQAHSHFPLPLFCVWFFCSHRWFVVTFLFGSRLFNSPSNLNYVALNISIFVHLKQI